MELEKVVFVGGSESSEETCGILKAKAFVTTSAFISQSLLLKSTQYHQDIPSVIVSSLLCIYDPIDLKFTKVQEMYKNSIYFNIT